MIHPRKLTKKSYKTASPITKGRITQKAMDGLSNRKIAEDFGVSKDQVRRIKLKFSSGQGLCRKEGSGRPRKISPEDVKYLKQKVRRNRFTTGEDLKTLHVFHNVSNRTIRQRLTEDKEFGNYWAVKTPYMKERQRIRRLEWARTHLTWSIEDWRNILWSDESPFVLRYNGKTRVWRLGNEANKPWVTVGVVKHDVKINVFFVVME